jgi:hypothetical protein
MPRQWQNPRWAGEWSGSVHDVEPGTLEKLYNAFLFLCSIKKHKINLSWDCSSPKFIASDQDLERFEGGLAVLQNIPGNGSGSGYDCDKRQKNRIWTVAKGVVSRSDKEGNDNIDWVRTGEDPLKISLARRPVSRLAKVCRNGASSVRRCVRVWICTYAPLTEHDVTRVHTDTGLPQYVEADRHMGLNRPGGIIKSGSGIVKYL